MGDCSVHGAGVLLRLECLHRACMPACGSHLESRLSALPLTLQLGNNIEGLVEWFAVGGTSMLALQVRRCTLRPHLSALQLGTLSPPALRVEPPAYTSSCLQPMPVLPP